MFEWLVEKRCWVLVLLVLLRAPTRCCCVALRDGDHYDALRDCLKALTLNPGHLKAHFRLARCLFELKYVAEALECLNDFKGKFPEQAHSNACDALDKDIKAALFSKSDSGLSAHVGALGLSQMHIVHSWNEQQTFLHLDTRKCFKSYPAC